MEYLVKISKKAHILELKRRNLKITILTSYTSYPSRKIRRICAYTSQETTKNSSSIRCTVFEFPPYPFNYPIKRLTIEEMLAKFIDEGLPFILSNPTYTHYTPPPSLYYSGAVTKFGHFPATCRLPQPPHPTIDPQRHHHRHPSPPPSSPHLRNHPHILTTNAITVAADMQHRRRHQHHHHYHKHHPPTPTTPSPPITIFISMAAASPTTPSSSSSQQTPITADMQHHRRHATPPPSLSLRSTITTIDIITPVTTQPPHHHIVILAATATAAATILRQQPNHLLATFITIVAVTTAYQYHLHRHSRVAPALYFFNSEFGLEEACTETMNRRCSSVFLNELPSKEKDPRSFTTPCQVLEKHKEAEDFAADHLSRFKNPHMEVLNKREIADKFFDENLMVLKSKFNNDEPWDIKPILKRLVGYYPKGWSEKLNDALWAFTTAYKIPIGYTPFRLVYGKSCHLPIYIVHKAHWALKQCNMDLTLASKSLILQLNELAKLRDGAYENTRIYKERTKKWHDSRLRGDKDFKVGDKDRFSFKVNGQRLKKYYRGNINKEDDEVIEYESGVTCD
uniref:Reverse transcriptase domain-containing protein n=1 Tax=Tanacetum cinerariifolium TaxID=118510 RepID=A0A6L2P0U1_TANCI|nr:hypothetical protein [Tanacetum cinerariifolium]